MEAGDQLVVAPAPLRRRARRDAREPSYRGEVAGVTPRLPRPSEGERFVRMAEVQAWLAAHPEGERFVILDDGHDFGPLATNHVRTDSKVGLTDEDVSTALAILDPRRDAS